MSKNLKNLPENSWIAQIKASNKNPGTALLVANDYRRFNYKPYVYKTVNYGKTWNRIVDEKDVFGYALSMLRTLKQTNYYFWEQMMDCIFRLMELSGKNLILKFFQQYQLKT